MSQLQGFIPDVAIVALDALPEQSLPEFHQASLYSPSTKILALAPLERQSGLSTLLKAESLHAHHLLARPLDSRQLLTLLQATLPASLRQG